MAVPAADDTLGDATTAGAAEAVITAQQAGGDVSEPADMVAAEGAEASLAEAALLEPPKAAHHQVIRVEVPGDLPPFQAEAGQPMPRPVAWIVPAPRTLAFVALVGDRLQLMP